MRNQKDKQEPVELKELNAELTESLKSCQKLLLDYRSKLAANSNISGDLGEDCEETLDRFQDPVAIVQD